MMARIKGEAGRTKGVGRRFLRKVRVKPGSKASRRGTEGNGSLKGKSPEERENGMADGQC